MRQAIAVLGMLMLWAGLAVATPAEPQSDDPNLWLEQVSDPAALDWVRRQNAVTRAEIEHLPEFFTLREHLQAALDSEARVPTLSRMGANYYNFWQDARHPRGVWRRTTLQEYRKAAPRWENVLDIDLLARQDHENWIYKGSVCREPEFDRCLIQLSRGGADAVVVREFDLKTKGFIRNGFALPEAKSSVAWRDRNSLFVATDFGAGSLTSSGYARSVRIWQRGRPLHQAQLVYNGEREDVAVSGFASDQGGVHRELIQRDTDFFSRQYWSYERGKLIRLDLPAKAEPGFFGNQILVTLHQSWDTSGGSFPAGALLAMDFEAFKKGSRQFTSLFTPAPGSALLGYVATRNAVLVQTLDHVKSALTEWRYTQGAWSARSIALPTLGSVQLSAVDAARSDDYFLSYSDYLNPSTYCLAQAGTDQREVLKTAPAFFDAAPLQIDQREARSADGTMIPYFLVHRKDMQADGKNPTLLYGYGGFEISLTPSYSSAVGLGWLNQGGVYAVANIRGGGEFGPDWHQAAVKENRQRAYDDFAAVAQDLVSTRITDVRHLGAYGGSNGGLLAGVMLTQHPELFHAIVSMVPLLDMRRYNKLLAGASWQGEYGNPDIPEQWAYISRYSPYQNVKMGVKYPDVMFMTSTRDDRVHPGHARKMAARMLDQGHNNVRYYENTEGGHGAAANNAQKADMTAMLYAWMWNELNPQVVPDR